VAEADTCRRYVVPALYEAGWTEGQIQEERGVDLAAPADAAGNPEADPLDLPCYAAFNAPLRTRRERAERVKRGHQDFFDRFGPHARAILDGLLEKYAEHGPDRLKLPDGLKVPPISDHGRTQARLPRHWAACRS